MCPIFVCGQCLHHIIYIVACHDWVNHAHISSILTLWLSSAHIFLFLYIFPINLYCCVSYIHAYQSHITSPIFFSLSYLAMWTLFNTLADIFPMNGLMQTFPPLCAFDFQFGQRKRACWYIRKHSPWEIVCFVWLSPAPPIPII